MAKWSATFAASDLASSSILASQLHLPSSSFSSQCMPLLVLVHGLLGSQQDWQPCFAHLPDVPVLTVDLPGHGNSAQIECEDLDHTAHLLNHIIAVQVAHLVQQGWACSGVILVGYSMGARITMHGIAHDRFGDLSSEGADDQAGEVPLLGAVIEAGHFGLLEKAQKRARWANDQAWAKRFVFEPIEQVLVDWYLQPVFSSLKHEQRQTLVAKRSANLGGSVAKMLLATSLATQSDLLPLLRHHACPIRYVCGEQDEKFKTLAQESGLSVSVVASAGHNVHQEQPEAFCRVVQQSIPK